MRVILTPPFSNFIFCTAVVLGCVAILGGCSGPTVEQAKVTAFDGKEVWTDPDTGCQYLTTSYDYRAGITPRLSSSGLPICGAR